MIHMPCWRRRSCQAGGEARTGLRKARLGYEREVAQSRFPSPLPWSHIPGHMSTAARRGTCRNSSSQGCTRRGCRSLGRGSSLLGCLELNPPEASVPPAACKSHRAGLFGAAVTRGSSKNKSGFYFLPANPKMSLKPLDTSISLPMCEKDTRQIEASPASVQNRCPPWGASHNYFRVPGSPHRSPSSALPPGWEPRVFPA